MSAELLVRLRRAAMAPESLLAQAADEIERLRKLAQSAAPTFLGVTLKVDHSLPPNIIEMRGANCVRMDVSTGEIQVKPAAAPVSGDVALPKPDVIAYTCIGDNDAYSEIALRTYGDARERSAIAAQTASPAKVGGSVREIPSADTPEFQQLAMYWRNEPCGSRAFENGWNELIAHIGTYAAALAAQTAAPQTVGGVDELSAFEQAAQACDQQADGTNGAYRTACLQCANAVRELRDTALAKQGEANG